MTMTERKSRGVIFDSRDPESLAAASEELQRQADEWYLPDGVRVVPLDTPCEVLPESELTYAARAVVDADGYTNEQTADLSIGAFDQALADLRAKAASDGQPLTLRPTLYFVQPGEELGTVDADGDLWCSDSHAGMCRRKPEGT